MNAAAPVRLMISTHKIEIRVHDVCIIKHGRSDFDSRGFTCTFTTMYDSMIPASKIVVHCCRAAIYDHSVTCHKVPRGDGDMAMLDEVPPFRSIYFFDELKC